MKATNQFKTTIEAMLNEMAEKDPGFKARMNREGKNMDDCVTYILNKVKKSGCVGFADSEILGMAAHYFDEDDIDIGNPVTNCKVVVNHSVELSEEEKTKAREDARKQLVEEEKERLKKRLQKKKEPKEAGNVQQSLF